MCTTVALLCSDPATLTLRRMQAIYLTGWAPHERQQQPLARGSANVSFNDLEVALSAPEKAPHEDNK